MSEKVNLKHYPRPRVWPEEESSDTRHTVSSGDMHGNAMKLIFIAFKEGVLDISEDQFKTLWEIYETPTDHLTAEQINVFETIIRDAKYNKSCVLRFIGDLLADRGRNDWFTLCVLQALDANNIEYEIMLSNHDMGFIRYVNSHPIIHSPRTSLINLRRLVAKPSIPQVTAPAINELYKKVYLKHLKVLSYDLNPGGDPPISVFTHAPVGMETIAGVAKELSVSFDESTAELLAASIDRINAVFSERMLAGDTALLGLLESPRSHLSHIMWNRAGDAALMNGRMRKPSPYTVLVRPLRLQPRNKSYPVTFVHGHDGVYTPEQANRVNIDSKLGMGETRHLVGQYASYRTASRAMSAAKVVTGFAEAKGEADDPIKDPALGSGEVRSRRVRRLRCGRLRLFSRKPRAPVTRSEGVDASDLKEAKTCR
ncbi:MAG: hypothetical protein P1U34_08470 [Coxiellaceae bacterium]|nr:hypothetical protein [Coxiellaceae bacterium]